MEYRLKFLLFIVYFLLVGLAFLNAERYYKIINKKKIVVGLSSKYPPLSFKNKKEGAFKGLEVKLAQKIASFLEVELELKEVHLHNFIDNIKNQTVDIVMSGISPSFKRLQQIWLTNPYLTIHPAILIDARILPKQQFGDTFYTYKINQFWDIHKVSSLKIAVKQESIYVDFLQKYFPQLERIFVNDNQQALQQLEKYSVNAWIHDSIYFENLLKENKWNSSYRLLIADDYKIDIGIAIPFASHILQNQLNMLINLEKKNGILKNVEDSLQDK